MLRNRRKHLVISHLPGCLLLLIALCMAASPASAQKKKAKKKAPAKAVVMPVVVKEEPTAADLLYENMLESTQRVLVIDSIVVDKADFLSHIPLPQECGTLTSSSRFTGSDQAEGIAFVNEFGNKAYYSTIDDSGQSQLLTRDKLGNQWSEGTAVEGIDPQCSPNYPFMMADGITFYFAQKGEGSLGGYDIFVTRYDSESGEFLRPNNIGLPFNSKANDYMYAVDELDSLGWFVSDRNQPEGKVCVYTFVPSKGRQNIDLSEADEVQVRQLAALSSISATWTDKREREAARQRLARMKNRAGNTQSTGTLTFVINDRLTYHSPDDFRSPAARKMLLQLLQARERQAADTEQLEALRTRYHESDADERRTLAPTILEAERELEQLNLSIRQAEKLIRNEENMFLTK